jgi:hypothetical protein
MRVSMCSKKWATDSREAAAARLSVHSSLPTILLRPRPPLDGRLLRSRKRQLPRRGVLVDRRPGTDGGIFADFDRGDELILPDQAARDAYGLIQRDRAAYDEVMRAQAARLDSLDPKWTAGD